MSDIIATWSLARGRFVDAVSGLSANQLNWKLNPSALSIGEMALHVAGVEISFASQLKQVAVEGLDAKLKAAATDGVVNANPFPFEASAITPELLTEALDLAKSHVEPVLMDPDPYRSVQIVSALGPVIDGTGAFARLAQHPAYHQGQAYLIKTAPGFPTE